MIPLLFVHVTGRGIALTLLVTLLTLAGLAGVWLFFGPGPAVLLTLAVIGLIRGLMHLFTPPK
ncbi:hypothetical protein GCM10027174_29640 [Salinifilum aidingensis]